MDVDLVVAALAHHLRVFDQAAVSRPESMDEQAMDGGADVAGDVLTADVGGFRILARRSDAWDAIVAGADGARRAAPGPIPSRDAWLPGSVQLDAGA